MNRPRKKNRHLPTCVYYQHGAYWHVKARRWSRLGSTLAAALHEYAALHEGPKGSMQDYIAQALPHITKGKAAATAVQYRHAAKKLSHMLQEFRPDQVKPKHLAKIKYAMTNMPNMANRCLSVARLLFNHWLELQLVDSNPAIGIARHVEARRTRVVAPAEYDAIYAKAGERLQIILELLRLTGQRIEDVLAIRRADLLGDGVRFKQKKTGALLVVRWTAELHTAVDRAIALQGLVPSLTLLRNRFGKRPDYRSVHLQFTQACTAAGVTDCHFHDLRAVAAAATKRQGKNPTALLGHSSAQQTVRYLREREETVVDGPSFRRLIDTGSK